MNAPATLGLGRRQPTSWPWNGETFPIGVARGGRRALVAPAEPTRAAYAPAGPEWVHEIKFDGFRVVAMKDNGRVRLWSRFGNDLTARFPVIRAAVAELPIDRVLIDGEAVVLRSDGYCDFGALLERRAAQEARLIAFDLLQIEGEDLRPLPLGERRTRLEALLDRERSGIMLSQTIAADGLSPRPNQALAQDQICAISALR